MCAKEINEKNRRHQFTLPYSTRIFFSFSSVYDGNPLTRFLVIIERSAVLHTILHAALHLSALQLSREEEESERNKRIKQQLAAAISCLTSRYLIDFFSIFSGPEHLGFPGFEPESEANQDRDEVRVVGWWFIIMQATAQMHVTQLVSILYRTTHL